MSAANIRVPKMNDSTPKPVWQPNYVIKEDTQAAFLAHITSMIETLQPNTIYTLEEICGSDIWKCYEKTDRLSLGSYISGLVSNERLSLVNCETNSANHKIYKL